MPTAQLVDGWAAEVPETFTFAVKAPQRITHFAKLVDAAETTADLRAHRDARSGRASGPCSSSSRRS